MKVAFESEDYEHLADKWNMLQDELNAYDAEFILFIRLAVEPELERLKPGGK